MAQGSSFRIPGNIKLQYTPFVLNPHANINKTVTASTSLQGAGFQPQVFTFKLDSKKTSSSKGTINVCPTSYRRYISNDIGLKTLGYDVNHLFNSIPTVSIREFLPDTKLDQCINFFSDMIDAVKELWARKDDDVKDKKKKIDGDLDNETKGIKERQAEKKVARGFIEKIKKVLWHAFDYLTDNCNPSLFTNLEYSTLPESISTNTNTTNYIVKFPYMLYYCLQSCVTTNIYELPCKLENNNVLQSDGYQGWKGNGSGVLGISGLLTKIPGIGEILNNIIGNIRINYMPYWDSDKGSQTPPPEVEVKFDLFNDSEEAAIINFIFVHTIILGNNWIQYNVFQHSQDLYDVQIAGMDRLFCCAGQFGVQYSGILRSVTPSFTQKLVSKHANKNCIADIAALRDRIVNERMIMIPDVYNVSMKFTSLIPANFNSHIYSFVMNNSMMSRTANGVYTKGLFTNVVQAATTQFIEEMMGYIESLN